MIRKLSEFVHNFFLHIEINTLNLPYWKLPRPYRSHPLSKYSRKIFENKVIRPLLGLNLAALAAVPLVSHMIIDTPQEPPLNIIIPELEQTETLSIVTTKEREFVLPVERLRYIGQYYVGGHAAYDLNSYVGDDIYAFTSGKVVVLEYGTFGLGRYIVLDHGHGLVSVYAHMKDFSVELNQTVQTGEKIGEVGMTGYTTGPHLHFEVHDDNKPVDPGLYLKI